MGLLLGDCRCGLHQIESVAGLVDDVRSLLSDMFCGQSGVLGRFPGCHRRLQRIGAEVSIGHNGGLHPGKDVAHLSQPVVDGRHGRVQVVVGFLSVSFHGPLYLVKFRCYYCLVLRGRGCYRCNRLAHSSDLLINLTLEFDKVVA